MSRGGGGVDPSWHRSGGGLHKLNSIYDFVSCGKFLVNEGYVCKDKLGAVGHSAGCLLVAAAINMCPDLFRAAIMKVSFFGIGIQGLRLDWNCGVLQPGTLCSAYFY